MSVRRPAPLVAQHQALSVGALADRLPGSTRLSQVLAAGAKHLAKHKTADTEAPGKRKIFGEVGERQTISRPIIAAYVNNLKRMVLDFMALQASGGSATQMQTLAQQIFATFVGIDQGNDYELFLHRFSFRILNAWRSTRARKRPCSLAPMLSFTSMENMVDFLAEDDLFPFPVD